MDGKSLQTLDAPANDTGNVREHRITDMHIIAWALVVIAFGTIWVAWQVTLIAGNF